MGIYVTDTHPLVWYTSETHQRLTRKTLRAFQRASRGQALIWVPVMVIWEAGLLQRIGRIRIKPSIREWADALDAQAGFAVAPMDTDIVYSSLDSAPKSDLFDVSIVATARQKGLPLITKDEAITQSGVVEIFW